VDVKGFTPFLVPGKGVLQVDLAPPDTPAASLLDGPKGRPVGSVKRGRRYSLRMDSFLKGEVVSVRLFKGCANKGDRIGFVTVEEGGTGKGGAFVWKWRVPKKVSQGDGYYLEVTSATGSMAFTQPFAVR
jgi:hypothetical protein